MNKTIEVLEDIKKGFESSRFLDALSLRYTRTEALTQAIEWGKQLEEVKKERDKWYECSQNLSDIVAKLKQENEELEKDQKRIIEACGYKKVVELQAQLSRVTVERVEKILDKTIFGKALSGKWVRWSKNPFGITTYLMALGKTAQAIVGSILDTESKDIKEGG